jgi:hypothetical protein
MRAGREAIVLPIVFLTVLLLGGLRIAGTTVLVPPSPYFLLLGVLLVRVVVQSGALAPDLLVASARSELANLNGVVLLATLWIASAQAVAVLIPESGAPRLAFSVFFLILLLNTAAASPDRQRLLRSLAVTFGAAFVLKFVVLHGLSVSGEGSFKRALLALVDGVTAGALVQNVPHPITAYIALSAVALFLIGVFLLPHREPLSHSELPQAMFRTLPPAPPAAR